MRNVMGVASNISKSIVGIATRDIRKLQKHRYVLICEETIEPKMKDFAAILHSQSEYKPKGIKLVHSLSKSFLASICDGDILVIDPDGEVRKAWEVNSSHNSFFITNQCNCRCIMCPQPPGNDPVKLNEINYRILKLLEECPVGDIGLTGGEPTLCLDQCLKILTECKRKYPEKAIALLTNGRLLSDEEKLSRILKIKHSNLVFCIPIHADISFIHDLTTKCKGSFAETISALQSLGLYNQKIEIRIVITKFNYARLTSIADFIYRNLPFCVHIAFMGMEVCGFAEKNRSEVWVDPFDYQKNLCEAVRYLHQRAMNVSIYNIPLCIVPEAYRRFAADSISEWKKGYTEICSDCVETEICPGLFLTSSNQSEHLRPILTK